MNRFAGILILICIGLHVYKGSVVTLITIKSHVWSTELWQYASCRPAKQQYSWVLI